MDFSRYSICSPSSLVMRKEMELAPMWMAAFSFSLLSRGSMEYGCILLFVLHDNKRNVTMCLDFWVCGWLMGVRKMPCKNGESATHCGS